eukprot:TRINITY_DN13050_c0_g3_i1.p1 TRINITY_DN13050_c0_g3~~TRINITY_DN13050_c0_g3_i1.p1  ORF type:complete len:1070 (-),score=211.05 TRINITY_DN13050_c0_g3_i1:153-3308(-)
MALPPMKGGLKSSLKKSNTQAAASPGGEEEGPLPGALFPSPGSETTKLDKMESEDLPPVAKPSKEHPLPAIKPPLFGPLDDGAPPPGQLSGNEDDKVTAEDTDGAAVCPLLDPPVTSAARISSKGSTSSPDSPKNDRRMSGRRRASGLALRRMETGGSNVTNPLKMLLLTGTKEVDIEAINKVFEDQSPDEVRQWIDIALDADLIGAMPPALIFAVGNHQADVVEVLLKHGADPRTVYTGRNVFNGWIKPNTSMSEIVMNRVGRFKGTMLGEELKNILELLQHAEIQFASADVQSITSAMKNSQAAISDFYDVGGEIPGVETDIMKIARHKVSGEMLAVKTEPKGQDSSVIWEELSLMRKLQHPNIPQLQESFEDASYVYIVTELCSGGHLFPRIAEAGGINCRTMSRFMQQMASAVVYLHSSGVCHHNIQPELFMVTELSTATLLSEATVKLIGFSSAKEFSSDSPMRIADGDRVTLQCVPPELLDEKERCYDAKIDVWSLGVVFFIMLTVSFPFTGDSERSILKKIKKGIIKWPVELESFRSANHLVQQMLSVDSQVRLNSLQVAEHPFFTSNTEDDKEFPIQKLSVEQMELLFDFRAKRISVDSKLLRDCDIGKLTTSMATLRPRKSKLAESITQNDDTFENPLENIMRSKKIDVKQLRAVLEAVDKAHVWIDKPLNTSDDQPLPAALIHAISRTLPDVVEVILEFGADPCLQHKGPGNYAGWIKPGTKLSECAMARRGRFIGTMVGDKLLKICELLQAAEAKQAQAGVDTMISSHTVGHPSQAYTIKGTIGKSLTSVTKKAVEQKSGESYAIKHECKKSEESIWEELAVIRRLAHDNVIKVKESFEDATNIFVVLDSCLGGSLMSKFVESQLSPSSPHRNGIECIFLQMAKAVEYIHSQSICHRALQPEHFLLSSTGKLTDVTVKLVDFTFAKDFGGGNQMKTRVCVPNYVAPEIVAGDGNVAYSERVDVWSLGVTYYLVSCGEQPFPGDDEADILDAVVTGKVTYNPDVWTGHLTSLRDLLTLMLEANAQARIPASQVVSHAYLNP